MNRVQITFYAIACLFNIFRFLPSNAFWRSQRLLEQRKERKWKGMEKNSGLQEEARGSQKTAPARTLVQLSLCKLSILVFPHTEKPIFEDWFN